MKSLRRLTHEILENTYLMSLATQDDAGVWVSDLIFVYDRRFTLYWVSQTSARHSISLESNPQVACSVTLNVGQDQDNIGLQIVGTAERFNKPTLALATKHAVKRNRAKPKRASDMLVPGQAWYRLTPTLIELIYEPYFGFAKRTVNL